MRGKSTFESHRHLAPEIRALLLRGRALAVGGIPTSWTVQTLPLPDRPRGWAVSAPAIRAGVVSLLAILGLTTVWSSVLMLWGLWTTDPLKSIGMLVPVVSFVLLLRVWRGQGWQMQGTWWGFALLLGTAVLVRLRDQSVMVLTLGPQWHLYFPPHSLVIFAYGVGVVLLFGGMRLVRTSRFPLLLLLLVNPVPHFFNVYVDLPLQRTSAHVARAFAHALGQPLSPDKLRLMFTPQFGMFIAPGCNGIRGAVTMGLIALVAGYLYRFRWRARVAVVIAAVLLGYVFNLLRLCVLVLYYVVAMHLPRLQDHAENADYVIGAGLFFVAVYGLYQVIERLGQRQGALALEVPQQQGEEARGGMASRGVYVRTLAMTGLVALGTVGVARGLTRHGESAELKADETALGAFPQRLGGYTLTRSWNETLLTGALLFHWAEYAPAEGGAHVALGLSPVLGSHDTLVCHTARGEDPLWHGQQAIQTAAAEPVNFSAALYNDGATQFLEVTTLCNGASCGEYVSPQAHFGFTYSKLHPQSLWSQNPERPIPILLRVETVDTTLPVETARQQLLGDVKTFLAGVRLDALTGPYRRP